jgi:peptide-methionine (S)-S-oxide reductase
MADEKARQTAHITENILQRSTMMKRSILSALLITTASISIDAFTPAPAAQWRRKSSSYSTKTSLAAIKESTFGMGCFWKPSEELLKVAGVVDTVAGYTGKSDATTAPSYENVCYSRDWVEGVRVYYDDETISYAQLLDSFFDAQEPRAGSRQYASIIFPDDAEQQEVAVKWLADNKDRARSDGITGQWTTLEPVSSFYRAEQYHQRYWQKTRPRVGSMIACLCIGSGAIDRFTPAAYLGMLHDGANLAVVLGLIFVILERKFDTKVVRLEPGIKLD